MTPLLEAGSAGSAVPGGYVDELDFLLTEHLEDLVREYLPVALENGTSEAQLRAWLTDEGLPDGGLLDVGETARLNGVETDTLHHWLQATRDADRANLPRTTACYVLPNISKGTRIRLWRRSRAIVASWRSGRLKPGTLEPIERRATGRRPGVTT